MANIAYSKVDLPLNLGISQTEVLEVLKKDAQLVSSNQARYSYENAEQYFCAVNAWVALCYDVCGSRPARFLRNMIIDRGLLRVIDDANQVANTFIRSDFTTDGNSYLYPLFTESSKDTLQLLRFLKRFSPLGCDKVRDQSLDAFRKMNATIDRGEAVRISPDGRVLHREYRKHEWLTASVARVCKAILGKAPSMQTVEKEASFSNGVTAEGCKTLEQKVIALGKVKPYLYSLSYPLSNCSEQPLDFVKVVAVPKSYKAWRIIAEVPAYQQYLMQGIRKLAVRAADRSKYGRYLVQDDQSINQDWAQLGSINQSYATLDLSAASDSIGQALAEKILPADWMVLLDGVNPPNINTNGKIVKRHIFQTSGNGTTFIFESIVFLAIAVAATEYYQLYTGESALHPRTFGDDLIVDTKVYETVVDFLSLLGFKVNLDKSFASGFYRESCGSEWYCGLDLSSKYWPRKELLIPSTRKDYERCRSNANKSLVSLIALQHKLYAYETVDSFLVAYIRFIAKSVYGLQEVTSSLPGSECDDLWEIYPSFVRKRAPHGGSLTGIPVEDLPETLTRERHLVLTAKYPDAGGCYEQLDMYKYVDFLRHGPRYEDPLSELLRVSAPSLETSASANEPEMLFGYTWV